MTEATKARLPNLVRLGTKSVGVGIGGRTDGVLDGVHFPANTRRRGRAVCRATRNGCREALAKACGSPLRSHAQAPSHMPFF